MKPFEFTQQQKRGMYVITDVFVKGIWLLKGFKILCLQFCLLMYEGLGFPIQMRIVYTVCTVYGFRLKDMESDPITFFRDTCCWVKTSDGFTDNFVTLQI